MKKLITTILLIIILAPLSYSQVKVNFSLLNPRNENGSFLIDLYATVPTGQAWSVGPTNIRIGYFTTPAAGISLTAESSVTNANSNISNNANYSAMTSTSILMDSACSLNILLGYNKTAYQFSAGSYLLGTLKFNVSNPYCCVTMNFKSISAVFNNSTPMVYLTDWSFTNPSPCLPVDVRENVTQVPDNYSLSQNFPNPFNPSTTIKYAVPKSGLVNLKVYDIMGREVSELVNGFRSAGFYLVDFNAGKLSSGIYYYKLVSDNFTDVKKMILIK